MLGFAIAQPTQNDLKPENGVNLRPDVKNLADSNWADSNRYQATFFWKAVHFLTFLSKKLIVNSFLKIDVFW